MVLYICILAALSIGLLSYALWPRRSKIIERIEELSGLENDNSKRIVVFDKLHDQESKDKLNQRLQEAGWYATTTAQMGYMTMTGLGIGAIAGLVINFTFHLSPAIAMIPALFGYKFPSYKLDKAIEKRKIAVQSELPDFIDMVSSTVAAGTALNGALLAAVDLCEGPLGDEFRAALADIRMGRSRADALTSMADRVNQQDLSQMITTIVQSERIGGNISKVLEELAEESRETRMLRAEEIAGSLPAKMTLPMGTCLLPSMFVIILGAVFVNVK